MAPISAHSKGPFDLASIDLSVEGIDLIEEVSRIVNKISGIQLGAKQVQMVHSRLTRRLLDLGLKKGTEYWQHFQKNSSTETAALVSLLTTHHTYFFREFSQFEYLEKTALPHLIQSLRVKGEKKIRIWSAACSKGQEVYSLSMFLNYHLKQIAPDFSYEILGSDVDGESVKFAKNGVYQWNEVKEIPAIYLSSSWVRGTGDISEFVKAKGNLKDPCRFETINLFNLSPLKNQKFDIIWCRNVFIYFTPAQIKELTGNMLNYLTDAGIFFVGLSENLSGLELPLTRLGPSIFGKEFKATKDAPSQRRILSVAPEIKAQNTRILCVDDSATVLTLLKKILTKESGFDVIATAQNGQEAAQILRTTKIDAMTLDIHMPVQNGVEYLRQNMSATHPPVVIVSSVSREDSELGFKTLELGAKDYVEKPTLSNLNEKGDEIRTKLRCAIRTSSQSLTSASDADQLFSKRSVYEPGNSDIRIIVAGLGDVKKVVALLSLFKGKQPCTFLLIHGSDSLLPATMDHLNQKSPRKFELIGRAPDQMRQDQFFCGSFESLIGPTRDICKAKKTSVICYGSISKASATLLKGLSLSSDVKMILEDLGPTPPDSLCELKKIATHYVPAPSFAYHSDTDLVSLQKKPNTRVAA